MKLCGRRTEALRRLVEPGLYLPSSSAADAVNEIAALRTTVDALHSFMAARSSGRAVDGPGLRLTEAVEVLLHAAAAAAAVMLDPESRAVVLPPPPAPATHPPAPVT